MNARLRRQRNEFLIFLAGSYVSLMCALPIVVGNLAMMKRARVDTSLEGLTFEQLDRNRDGYIDRREAGELGGLDAVFNKANRRSNGRLDKVEFAQALALMTDRSRR
jgi:hypothetical protein